MRKHLNNIIYLSLVFLLGLNIALRIPWTPHGVDTVDSAFIWSLANSISASGSIKWMIHPLSFFGLYPLSYPSASPLFLSVASQLSGIDVEHTILIYGFLLGILGMLGAYVMALRIRDDLPLAFITAFVFSTAPVFVEYTRWTATTRNLFIALFPLFLWAMFWFDEKSKIKYKQIMIIIILIIVLFSAHRLSFLLPLTIVSYFIARLIWYIRINQI